LAEHFHLLTVAEIVPETAEANSIRFDVPEGLAGAFRFRAGQHVTLRATIGGEEVRRNYSLCVAPDEGEFKVTVKRIAGADVPMPYSKALEQIAFPHEAQIVDAVVGMLARG